MPRRCASLFSQKISMRPRLKMIGKTGPEYFGGEAEARSIDFRRRRSVTSRKRLIRQLPIAAILCRRRLP